MDKIAFFTALVLCTTTSSAAWAQAANPTPSAAPGSGQSVQPAPAASPSVSGSGVPLAVDPQLRAQLDGACRQLGYVPTAQRIDGGPADADGQPKEIAYENAVAGPQGYRLVERSRKGLWVPGVAVGSALYGLSLMVATGSLVSQDRILALPLAGPIIRLIGEERQETRALLTFDAAGQIVSAALIYLGFTQTKKVWVLQHELTVGVVPVSDGDTRGVSLLAQF